MSDIIFAGAGKIGEQCLAALQKKFTKISIVNQENDSILSLARDSDEVIHEFNDSDSDYVFLAGWYPLIKKAELKAKKFINIHGSLLPKYRGMHSLYWAIMNFEDEIGYTIHEVNTDIDDGAIIYQFKFKYSEQPIGEIHELFYKDIQDNLAGIITSYMSKEITPIKQDKNCATWVPRRNLDDCKIQFNWSHKKINRFFLALTAPYPLPRIVVKSQPYEVLEYKLIDRDYYCDVGRVVNIDSEGVWIKTKEGLLVISSVKNTQNLEIVDPRNLMKIGYRFN